MIQRSSFRQSGREDVISPVTLPSAFDGKEVVCLSSVEAEGLNVQCARDIMLSDQLLSGEFRQGVFEGLAILCMHGQLYLILSLLLLRKLAGWFSTPYNYRRCCSCLMPRENSL